MERLRPLGAIHSGKWDPANAVRGAIVTLKPNCGPVLNPLSSGHGSARLDSASVASGFSASRFSIWAGGTDWGYDMCSSGCAKISCAERSCVVVQADPVPGAARLSAVPVRKTIQALAVALGAASLAACAQSSVVSKNSGFFGSSRQASLQHNRTVPFTTGPRVVSVKKPTPFDPHDNAAGTPTASRDWPASIPRAQRPRAAKNSIPTN
jgi:hypothetical protein